MSAFSVGKAESSGPIELHALLVAGAVAPVTQHDREVLPKIAADAMPGALLMLDLGAFCDCGSEQCPGIGVPKKVNVVVGWEGVAAMIGQLRAMLALMPVGLQDQAAALEADMVRECAELPWTL